MKKPKIKQYYPCNDECESYQSCDTFEQFWETCSRGDWMMGIVENFGLINPENKRIITLVKGLQANTVRKLMRDDRSKQAVDTAIKYGKGEATDDELHCAAADAADAAVYAAADAAAYAAAYAAADGAYAAADAAAAVYAAVYAAADADAADADTVYKRCADICREHLTDIVYKRVEELNKEE